MPSNEEYEAEIKFLNERILILTKDNELLSRKLNAQNFHEIVGAFGVRPVVIQNPSFSQTLLDITNIHNVRPYNSPILTGLKPMRPIEELLLMQSKGKKLTKEEKDRCVAHAEMIRKKRKK